MQTQDEINNSPKGLNFIDNGKVFLYKYIDIDGALKLIKNQTFKFSNPRDFNDPFDLYEKLIDFSKNDTLSPVNMARRDKRRAETASDKVKIKLLQHQWRKLRSNYGISCFSKTYKNILMWSHYADKHTGVCIGFYIDALKLMDDGFITFAVEYKDNFMPLPFSDIDINVRLNSIMQYLSLKAAYWSYEEEIRMINFDYYLNYKDSFFDFRKYAEIREIHFGLRTSEKNKSLVKKNFSSIRNKPKFYEMVPVKNKIEIERK